MKRLLAGILASAAAIFAVLPAAADAPNLTGKWRPNLQRSTSEKPAAHDPNAVAPPAPTAEQAGHPGERIEQSASNVKITPSRPGRRAHNHAGAGDQRRCTAEHCSTSPAPAGKARVWSCREKTPAEGRAFRFNGSD